MSRMRILWGALVTAIWLWGGVALAQGNAYVGQEVRIRSGEVVEGDVSIFGGSAVFEEESLVKGDVAVMAGNVAVNGRIQGNLVAFGGVVDLGASAVIEGDVVALGTVRRHPEAQIYGRLVMGLGVARSAQMFARPQGERPSAVRWLFPEMGVWVSAAPRTLAVLLALVGAALVVTILLPENLTNIAQVMMSSSLLSIEVGLLTFVLMLFLVPILVILCLGIPVAVALLLALSMGVLVGWVAVGKILGERLLSALRASAHPALAASLGVGLISLLAQVPCVGWLLGLFVLFWGLGATILTRFGFGTTSFWPPERAPKAPLGELPQSEAEPNIEGRDTHPLGDVPPSLEG